MDFSSVSSYRRDVDKTLRRLFSGRIKGNFLTEIEYLVLNKLGDDILNYYDFELDNTKILSSNIELFDFDICRHIVGLHRSNLIFNTEDERLEKERNAKYKELLVEDVIKNIKLREYGSVYFRKKALMSGENFIFFHIPYDLFVLCVRMQELLTNCDKKNRVLRLFSDISSKGLTALTLLEDNFLNDVYPVCRGIIELYVKLLVLLLHPDVTEHLYRFANFELQKSKSGQDFPNEFIELYNNRKNKSCTNKIDYLHFGWLDFLDDYHSEEKRFYSISGIISYLKTKFPKEQVAIFDNLEVLYKICHAFVHGNVCISKYPLSNYFEISIILYYTIFHTYILLCTNLGADKKINDIDIESKLVKDFDQLLMQCNKRSTENYENYYKDKLNQF